MKLQGKVAIVTAASSDRGSAIAELLASEGAAVTINYLKNRKRAESALKRIESCGGKAMVIQADVTVKASVNKMVTDTIKKFGSIDILVNNAHGTIQRRNFKETKWKEFIENLNGTIKGAHNCCQAVISGMQKKQWGRIINIMDNIVNDPVKGYTSHTTAQSALVGLTRILALELGHFGITVNLINAGFTLAEKTPHVPPRIQKVMAEQTPLKRLAVPIDIAKAVLFYTTDFSDFITGNCLTVDGGKTMR
ncbi:3-oxoacyl-[acyl-carrier protein] reductase [Candidatus Scalindua japonica]|uniref:3-oxoacyl-[acyl-carrier protein] reductase n=1 Tax=Candidatus Scalindua japonica TaxID=1284222 RepID=A0A286U1L3_9BACT|nr:SDR family oxidoreductase [Candidatus Scalindua japonica]GAX62033.1 3-oxoacyl-[acyl-carrier protein] reductase [Candidatus Scalindua japonica]